jgi:hypothetical protein
VATGARKDKVAGQFAFTKATNGRYIVTRKDDLIFVYDTRGGVVNAGGEEKVPIAFFRAPSPVERQLRRRQTRLPLAARAAPYVARRVAHRRCGVSKVGAASSV